MTTLYLVNWVECGLTSPLGLYLVESDSGRTSVYYYDRNMNYCRDICLSLKAAKAHARKYCAPEGCTRFKWSTIQLPRIY